MEQEIRRAQPLRAQKALANKGAIKKVGSCLCHTGFMTRQSLDVKAQDQ